MTGTALITGGQRGIGLGIAEALAKAGWRVGLTARGDADGAEVREALERLGPDAHYVAGNIADVEGHAAMLDEIESELGPVTTFVSNAGVPARVRGDMLKMTPENFDFVLDVNLRGAFFLAQEVARRMLAREAGDKYRSLVFVTSVSATMASIERAEYCISKCGAAMMAQLFALRLAPNGIGAFELRPGIIETGMTAGVHDAYTARIEGGLVPAARWGTPADIGRAVVPIAQGAMAFSSGSAIPVDGGLSIERL